MKNLLYRIGIHIHTWKPHPQSYTDYVRSQRAWTCKCGKQQLRRELVSDPVKEVLERAGLIKKGGCT